jgi:acetate kinase
MSDAILTLNAGSSSIKFALFNIALSRMVKGEIEDIDTAMPHFLAYGADGDRLADQTLSGALHEDLLDALLAWIDSHLGANRLVAAGHRIVHGGQNFVAPVRLDQAARASLTLLEPLAPLHQPHNLAAVAALAKLRPGLLQVGCFDTAFHHTMDTVRRRFGLPRALEKQGIRRYGFHGLSYEFIAGCMEKIDPARSAGRIVVAHLGSGSSLCALHEGKSVDTSMSFTPLDGLVMGTRCGALDPGVVLYLMQAGGMSASQVEDLLYHRSGLLGVSGISDDMRILLASDRPEAREAIDLFVFRIVREIGAMAASLGGLDGLVFTGGIGENAPAIRARVLEALDWLGFCQDARANAAGALQISVPGSRTHAWVIRTDEEQMIARHTSAFLD